MFRKYLLTTIGGEGRGQAAGQMTLGTPPPIQFFVIGAARSGTTSLFRHLTARTDVHTPRVKEPRFFSTHWARGWDWYANEIGRIAPDRIAGDFSPNYSNSDGRNPAAERIAAAYPEARILYLVRNPIACAISNWRMAADVSGTAPGFAEALNGDWAVQLRHRSQFYRQISQYRAHFPDHQILVAPLEAIRAAPAAWIDRIERHIGLPPSGAVAFPKANASFRKSTRPAAPEVPERTRQAFCAMVDDDARRILDYAGQPRDLWSIGVGASAWAPSA